MDAKVRADRSGLVLTLITLKGGVLRLVMLCVTKTSPGFPTSPKFLFTQNPTQKGFPWVLKCLILMAALPFLISR